MQTPIAIRFRASYFVLLALLSPLTLFILPIAMPFEWRKWPRTLDDEGLTLRSGTRIPWRECTNVVTHTNRTELIFGATTVPLYTRWFVDGEAIRQWVRKRLGV
jgi:hypothetical protein